MQRVLNVGGGSKEVSLPMIYDGWEHVLLDIDPKGSPDICLDARELKSLPEGGFDAVYCSHNLEHYYRHDVRRVLEGFLHVLQSDGFADIRVPDLQALMERTIRDGLDVDDVIYTSRIGPTMVLDVIYGHSIEIERSGHGYWAHKTGFSQKSLLAALGQAGFGKIFSGRAQLEVIAVAFKTEPNETARSVFKIG